MYMAEYVLSCCSTADLSEEHFKDRDIKCIYFHFMLGDTWYLDDLGKTVNYADFYKRMAEGEMTKTSQINAEEYKEFFEAFLEDGKDVIHLSLSSGISGTVNSARIAKEELEEKYPDRKIYVVDSLAASSGYGLLMDKLADLRDEGYTIEELNEWALEHRLELNHWFFSTDLQYYVRGGRISKAAGFLGGMLNICPLLNVDEEGKLIPRKKCRGEKKASAEIVEKMKTYAKDGLDYADKCYISNSAFPDCAQKVAKDIENIFPRLKGKVEIDNIGTTIGAHTGPGTVALFFWGRDRREIEYN